MPSVEQITDLINLTLPQLGKMKVTDNMNALQEYVAATELVDKSRMTVESGDSIEYTYVYQHSSAATMTSIGDTLSANIVPMSVRGSVPWRFGTTNYVFDRREKGMNSGESQIFNLIKLRRAGGMASWFDLLEENFWSKPADSTDTTNIFGIDYWIVGYSGTPGFNGGNPTGFSSGRAGISSSTYTRYQNWAGTYTDISKADLITKMRKASRYCMFKSPNAALPQYSTKPRYGYYTTYDVRAQFETIAEAQNENLGNDMASKDGNVLFKGVPVIDVPKLTRDNDSTDPVYGVDWGTMKTVVKSGEWANEHAPLTPHNRPNEVIVYADWQFNTVCYDPRRNFKLNK